MELLAVKLEKKQNGSTEVYAEKKWTRSKSATDILVAFFIELDMTGN